MLCREWKAARAAVSDLRADLVIGVPEREKLGTPPEKVLVLHVGSTFSALAADGPGRSLTLAWM